MTYEKEYSIGDVVVKKEWVRDRLVNNDFRSLQTCCGESIRAIKETINGFYYTTDRYQEVVPENLILAKDVKKYAISTLADRLLKAAELP